MTASCADAGPRAPGVGRSFECVLDAALASVDALVEARRLDHRHVLVAALPKSASTWFGRVLVEATGFRPYWLNPLGHDTDRDILRTAIPLLLGFDTVTVEHVRASRSNNEWLRRLGIRPIVLVRDIFDVVVSMRDHSLREPGTGPAGRTPEGFEQWTARDQLWFCVRAGAPWALGLHASWSEAEGLLPIEWIRYEDLVREPAATVERALRHAGAPVSAERIERALAVVDPAAARFNHGRSGRGREELDADQIAAIERVASAYGACDLRRIGLGAPGTVRSGARLLHEAPPRRLRAAAHGRVRLPDDLDAEDAERIAAWRAAGLDDGIVAAAATFRRLDRMIARPRGSQRSVFIASFPTVPRAQVTCAVARAAGLRAFRIAPVERDLEENILAERLVPFLARDRIACHCTRATRANVARLDAAGVRPVVVVRDLFETLAALPEWIDRTRRRGAIGAAPSGEISRAGAIRLFTPWLLDFVASWQLASPELDVLWITEAAWRDDPGSVVARILDHAGLSAQRADAPAPCASPPRRTRPEARPLDSSERDEVRAIAAAWRGGFDFSVIGL